MTLSRQQTRLLNAIVSAAPKLDAIFGQRQLPDQERGACVTYSRMLVEVLSEVQIKAEVRAVYLVTANEPARAYLAGKISREEALSAGGKVQLWGDIQEGQAYQHAVCYIVKWDTVIDLSISPRASRAVPCQPYWAELNNFPLWIVSFEFRDYPLESRGYDTHRKLVRRGKALLRQVTKPLYVMSDR